jgi:hypothetical protein
VSVVVLAAQNWSSSSAGRYESAGDGIRQSSAARLGHSQAKADFVADCRLEDSMGYRSNLQRDLKDLEHIVEYTPGRGRGNFSCFRFRELDFSTQQGVEKGLEKAVQKAVQKAVVFEPLIRKEDQNQNQDQSQRLLVAPSSDRSLRSESGHQA